MKPSGKLLSLCLIRGTLKKSDDGLLFKISEGFEDLHSMRDKIVVDINFYPNRVTFQLQHLALKWFEQHSLFDVLVNNQRYF